MELIQATAKTVRDRIVVLRQARDVHAQVVSGREKAKAELQAVMAERRTAQARLADKEREIALTDSPVPEEALPEEAEVNRLGRHVRIREVRLKDWEERVQKSDDGLKPLIRDVEQAWDELGVSTGGALLDQFRDSAAALRDAWMHLLAFGRCFSDDKYRRWPFLGKLSPIQDLQDGSLLLDLHDGLRLEKWTTGAQELLAELDGLRTEIAKAKAG